MKILFVHFGDEQLRGSERCLINLMQDLHANGHQIALACNQVVHGTEMAAWCANAPLCTSMRPVALSETLSVRAMSEWVKCYRSLKAFVDDVRPDLVVCNSAAPCQWMVPLTIWRNIPLVGYLHTSYLPGGRLSSLIYGSTQLVGVSEFTVASLRADKFPPARISVVHNGVRPLTMTESRLAVRTGWGLGPQAFVFCAVGALVDWKRLDVLIEAVLIARSNGGREVCLVVVGDGPERARLEALAVGAPVHFAGWQVDVSNLVGASDCLVSAAEREAFGLSVIEAASLGVPALVPRVGAFPEVVLHNETGCLYEPGSAMAAAALMVEMATAKIDMKRLAVNARRDFDSRFTATRMTSTLETLFDAVVQSHGRARRHERIGRVWSLCRSAARLAYLKLLA